MIKVFNDFLPEEKAEELSAAIYDTPEHWWSHVHKYDKTDTPIHYQNTLRDEYRKKEIEQDFIKSFHKGDLKNPFLYESFVSSYSSGDFLNLHSDKQRGIAFILNLTQGWKPEYGGLLNVIKDENNIQTIFPKFNSLVLLNLGEAGTPHFVSEVSKYAPFSRIAISGWYNAS
jgi:Rps23 Pro-64 3,4-dihydroxylase Tpa1-like proline 4-hydroxylase